MLTYRPVKTHLVSAILMIACLLMTVLVYVRASANPSGRLGIQPDTQPAAYLLTDGDISATPPLSPERTVLDWWRAMQYSDFMGAYALLSPKLRHSLPYAFYLRQGRLAESGGFFLKPRIAGESIEGRSAKVYVQLQDLVRGRTVSVQPMTFDLTIAGFDWRLAEVDYVLSKAAEALAAEHAPSSVRTAR